MAIQAKTQLALQVSFGVWAKLASREGFALIAVKNRQEAKVFFASNCFKIYPRAIPSATKPNLILFVFFF